MSQGTKLNRHDEIQKGSKWTVCETFALKVGGLKGSNRTVYRHQSERSYGIFSTCLFDLQSNVYRVITVLVIVRD